MEAQLRSDDQRQRLPNGIILDNFYVIEGEIGAGGFGITYQGRDTKLGLPVAIKEYFPADIGNRDRTMSVHPVTEGQGAVFHWGREGFIREAQMLASFKHPGIVRVLRYFEANNTAYMVLEYEKGYSLARWLERLGRLPTQIEIDKIASRLMDALEAIHRERLVHRDIAPDNIIIRPDGNPVLLDFGAARYEVAEATRSENRSFQTTSFAIIKHHYSPFEQRLTDTRVRGPWSDIYSLGATLYRAVTEKIPPDANDRMGADSDPLVPAAKAAAGSYRPEFLRAVDLALQLKRQDRPQSVSELRKLFGIETADKVHEHQGTRETTSPGPIDARRVEKSFSELPDHRLPAATRERSTITGKSLAATLAFGILVAGGIWMLNAAPRLPPAGEVVLAPRAGEQPSDRESPAALKARRDQELQQVREDTERLQFEKQKLELERTRASAAAEVERQRRAIESSGPSNEPARSTANANALPPTAVGPTLWNHNGSVMVLEATGNARRFVYKTPRAGLLEHGVKVGTLLFNGTKDGESYKGTARIFRRGCQPFTYDVAGPVAADQRRVVMTGTRPNPNAQCGIASYASDELVFDFIGVDNAALSISPPPITTTASTGSEIRRKLSWYFEGEGYFKRVQSSYSQCETYCLQDRNCHALELHRKGSTCRLYNFIPTGASSNDSEVGIKSPLFERGILGGPKIASWRSGEFEVQIGAFASEITAQSKLNDVRNRLGDALARANTVLRPLQQGDQRLHRARFVGFSEDAARSVCDRIKALQNECFVTKER